ncbi:MAG TPA: YdcF family protein [Methylomusa anaerophila]|uniref:DUF218 domain-containing protein n=1 Tax=Methylomusa anaerophila TaxID=1930071 RepID=A0A348AMP4_9FIRM|nr:YdcF family protein [Methylomusa anaerophila]BBB92342.1 hypothetical protein MAMMFC1_03035 [Methylomusa anaerophila]HML90019.1 YdcF family protein [Methylomusa anaerophila]
MLYIKFFYSTFLLPPGIFILIFLLYFIYLFRLDRRKATLGLLITFIFYLTATHLVGDYFIRSLEGRYSPSLAPNGDVIVMLGGGATMDTPNVNGTGNLSGSAANRLLTSAQLFHLLNVPIIVSGGKTFENTGTEAKIARHILLGLGVPEEKIIMEDQSRNTTENAMFTKTILNQYGFYRPILVTSAFHMERAVRQFAKFGVNVTPYPTDYQTNIRSNFEGYQLWPSCDAMLNFQLALKEYVGILASEWY